MARITVTNLGGGPNDATGTYATISSATDIMSYWTPSYSTAKPHGGFDSTGVTLNQNGTDTYGASGYRVKPIRVVAMYGNTGGTSGGGNSAASFRWQLSTSASGNGNQETVTHTTSGTASVKYANNYNTNAEYDTSTLDWSFLNSTHATQVEAGRQMAYGFKGMTSGNFVFARGGTGTIYVNGTASTAWAGNSISAAVVWDTVPDAPTNLSVTINPNGTANFTWTVGSDDGMTSTAAWDDSTGAHITGYNIVYKASTDSAWKVFKSNIAWATPTPPWSVSGTSRSISNLAPDNGYLIPGQTYNFMIAGLNKVTDATTTYKFAYTDIQAQTGTRSASANAQAPGGIWTGTAWSSLASLKIRNSSNAWVTPTTIQVYTGSTWKRLM
jgi:hypothetical protein